MRGDKMHHAWLLTGPKGIGKASFAKAVTLKMLAEFSGYPCPGQSLEVPENHPAAQLVKARSHPDFKLVEREIWEKPPKIKVTPFDERKPDDQPAKSIRVVQIRWLEPILAMAPSQSAVRVVLIDAADELEINAANALLKMLEEPPKGTIFLLVSHASGRLLPTIRSRCRALRFGALDDAAMTSVLRSHLPEATSQEIAALVAAGEGSPGRALSFAGLDIAGIDASLARLSTTGDLNNVERSTLAQKLSTKAAQARYKAFIVRAPAYIAAQARMRQGDDLAVALDQWQAAKSLSQTAISGSLEPQSVVFALASHVAALAPVGTAAKA